MREDVEAAIELLRELRGAERLEAWESLLSKTPKVVYCHLSNRQNKALDSQADVHNLSLRGDRIDLGKIIREFHDLLARNVNAFATTAEKRQKIDYENRILEQRIAILEADVQKKKGQLVERSAVRARLLFLQGWIRNLGDWLGKRCGKEIQRELNDRLEELAIEFESGRVSMEFLDDEEQAEDDRESDDQDD